MFLLQTNFWVKRIKIRPKNKTKSERSKLVYYCAHTLILITTSGFEMSWKALTVKLWSAVIHACGAMWQASWSPVRVLLKHKVLTLAWLDRKLPLWNKQLCLLSKPLRRFLWCRHPFLVFVSEWGGLSVYQAGEGPIFWSGSSRLYKHVSVSLPKKRTWSTQEKRTEKEKPRRWHIDRDEKRERCVGKRKGGEWKLMLQWKWSHARDAAAFPSAWTTPVST